MPEVIKHNCSRGFANTAFSPSTCVCFLYTKSYKVKRICYATVAYIISATFGIRASCSASVRAGTVTRKKHVDQS